MSGRDKSDHNQKNQCTKDQSQKNPKPDLQSIQDNEKAQNAQLHMLGLMSMIS